MSYTESQLMPGARIVYQAQLHWLPFLPAYMLANVETIGVEQSLIGRLLDYGTIVVMLTGGTREPFRNIAQPLEFRRQVQSQIGSVGDRVSIPGGAATPGAIAQPRRDERECPYCAELILKKAKVCKHCQRDVQALV